MAYSSIGHMGFALVGLAAGTAEGIQGVLVYMAIYVTMTLKIFACIIAMRRKGKPVEDLTDLAGLARTKPFTAFFFAMLMFSMAGVPPLAGFFAKFYVFLAAIQAGLFTLAVLGVITSVVGAYYYLLIKNSRCISTSRSTPSTRSSSEVTHSARDRRARGAAVLRLPVAAGGTWLAWRRSRCSRALSRGREPVLTERHGRARPGHPDHAGKAVL